MRNEKLWNSAFLGLAFLCCLACAGCFGGTRTAPGTATAQKTLADNTNGVEDIEVSLANGTKMTVPPGGSLEIVTSESVQPEPPAEPAMSSISSEGEVNSSSGKAAKIVASIGAMQGHFWVGLLLVLCGGVLWLMKRQAVKAVASLTPTGRLALMAAKMPKGTGLLVMGTGVTIIVLPWFLETGGWILHLAAIAVLGILIGKWALNHVQGDPKEAETRRFTT